MGIKKRALRKPIATVGRVTPRIRDVRGVVSDEPPIMCLPDCDDDRPRPERMLRRTTATRRVPRVTKTLPRTKR